MESGGAKRGASSHNTAPAAIVSPPIDRPRNICTTQATRRNSGVSPDLGLHDAAVDRDVGQQSETDLQSCDHGHEAKRLWHKQSSHDQVVGKAQDIAGAEFDYAPERSDCSSALKRVTGAKKTIAECWVVQ